MSVRTDYSWSRHTNTNALPIDVGFHGTHVASIISGSRIGISLGIAPAAKILSIRTLDSNNACTVAQLLVALDYVAGRDDIRIVNLSVELPGMNSKLRQALSILINSGKIIVSASGNNGLGSVTSPASVPGVISVGAVDSEFGVWGGSASGFANWVTGESVQIPVLCAPGIKICGANSGGGQRVLSGTSMAAPHVSGVIAMMIEDAPQSPLVEIKERLRTTCIDVKPVGPDSRSGYGLVKAPG